jgi:hypothetical protein
MIKTSKLLSIFISLVTLILCNDFVSGQEEQTVEKYYRMDRQDILRMDAKSPSFSGSSVQLTNTSGKNTTLIGRWANGPCYTVAVKGDTVFFNNGGYLEIVKFNDPANPVELGKILMPSMLLNIAIDAKYAYVVAYNDGLRIIDISVPSNPVEVGFFDTGDYTCAVAVSNDYAYVVDEVRGMRIIDVSTPSNPIEVGYINDYFDKGGYTYDVAISGNYAYLAADYFGLCIIDISNPTNPFEVARAGAVAGNDYGVAISGNYAYVNNDYSGFRIIDISNPSDPSEVGSLIMPWNDFAWEVEVSGNYAYVVEGNGGLRIIDVSTPSRPCEVGFYNRGGNPEVSIYVNDVALIGNYAYVAGGRNGLHLIDISTPATPSELGFFDTGYAARGIAVIGDYAYIADHSDGLRILDISTPENPSEIGFCYNINHYEAECVAIEGNYAYVTYNKLNQGGLSIVDISNPSNPVEVGYFDIGRRSTGIAVKGNYAYVGGGCSGGLRIIDITNPSSPVEVGFIILKGDAEKTPDVLNVAISGNYAYVADFSGFFIIDISSPSEPLCVGSFFFDTESAVEDVAVNGNYAYLAVGKTGEYRLHIIDISTPADLKEVGRFIGGNGYSYDEDIAVCGKYVYLADRFFGLRLFDISDPSKPSEVGSFQTRNLTHSYMRNFPRDVAVVGDYAYLADGNDGVYIIRNDLLSPDAIGSDNTCKPEGFRLDQNYPNPFNPSTTISFALPKNERVKIKIYDILGREIRTLINTIMQAGIKKVEWNGLNSKGHLVPSGIYFYKLEAGNYKDTKRMLIIK